MLRFPILLALFFLFVGCRYSSNPTEQTNVPTAAFQVLNHIEKYNRAPKGYVGGRKFGNYEQLLPKKSATGLRIAYREWDIHPKIRGKNRGPERLVTSSDQRAYYSPDHYKSFILMQQ